MKTLHDLSEQIADVITYAPARFPTGAGEQMTLETAFELLSEGLRLALPGDHSVQERRRLSALLDQALAAYRADDRIAGCRALRDFEGGVFKEDRTPLHRAPPGVLRLKGVEDLYEFIGYVVLGAPDQFPVEDFLEPEQQMTLDLAFELLREGVEIAYPPDFHPEKRPALYALLDRSLSAYRAGDRRTGAHILQDFESQTFSD